MLLRIRKKSSEDTEEKVVEMCGVNADEDEVCYLIVQLHSSLADEDSKNTEVKVNS